MLSAIEFGQHVDNTHNSETYLHQCLGNKDKRGPYPQQHVLNYMLHWEYGQNGCEKGLIVQEGKFP